MLGSTVTAGDEMKTRYPNLTALICALLLAAPPGPLHAENRGNTRDDAPGIDKQRAVEIADRVYSGRTLAVKRKGKVYRVKKLNEHGEVRTIVIDANDGEVLGR